MGVCPCKHAIGSFAKNVFSHLSKGVCPRVTSESHISNSSTKKRKHGKKDPIATRKRACIDVDRRWGYSLDLMLYDDPWKIKNMLQESDIGNKNRLLLGKKLAENLVLPVLGANAQRDAKTTRRNKVGIWDVDTNSMHSLVFKRWSYVRCYFFIGKWIHWDRDEIGFHWDPYPL